MAVKLVGIGVTSSTVTRMAIVVLAKLTVILKSKNIYEKKRWDSHVVLALLPSGYAINISIKIMK